MLMKFSVTTLFLAMMLAGAHSLAADAAPNPLKPKGNAGPALTIVADGKPAYSIVIPADPTPQEKKAADDLRQWIKEMTGAELKITAKAPSPVISISTDREAPSEQYQIAIENGQNIKLTGGPGRGVINAVYALLEEDLGCRWYTNDSIKLPKSPTLTISPVARSYSPQLIMRDPFYHASFDATWSLRNRTNAPDAKVPEEFGGRVEFGGLFVHTHAALMPPDKYAHDHPDYFFKNAAGQRSAAQLCPTDPHTIEIVTASVLKVLKEHPETEIISVSKNDSGGDQICHCDRCEKNRAEEGGAEMGNQLVLVNAVAEAVEKAYPKVLVDTLAYLDTVAVPKKIRPRKNVVIRLCNDSGAWNRPFTPARQLGVAAITKQWAAVCDKLSIWDYNVNFSHYLAPMPNMDVIADNIRFWVENHAVGVMTQGGYQSTSERDELRSWVIAKLMWDPSLDVNALVDDFTAGHYGKAAGAMKEYEALLASTRKEHEQEIQNPPSGIRFPMTIGYLSKDFLAKATEIFAKAEKDAAGDEVLVHRVERAELPILYVKLAQGPITQAVFDRFERIAKREKASWMAEGTNPLDQQLAEWRKQLPKPATTAAAAATQPTLVISKGPAAATYQAFPDACRLKNGDILCVFYAGYGHVSLAADDFSNGGRICMVRSSDEGRTWSEPQIIYDDADDNRDSHIVELDDGTLLVTFFSWQMNKDRLKSYKDFSYKLFREMSHNTGVQMIASRDGGKTWDKQARSLFPDWVCSAPVRQLPDGTCILGVYQKDKEKGVDIGGSSRSSDRGATWETPVKINNPPGVSLAAETDIIRLNDGKLFAALRDSKLNMRYATSADAGKSWSEAADIGFKGHCPHLNRLSTGEIILCHRLPQTSIHISRDDTKTWQGPYEIDQFIGAYPATVELKDGSVLIVYYTEGKESHIRARRFKLTKDGIEFLSLEKQ
jgi:hypothetical protein